MIYETAYVVKADASEESLNTIKSVIADTLKQYNAETLVNDTWGVKHFAQPTEEGIRKGNFFYVMYKSEGAVNAELERRFRLSEDVIRFLIINLGVDADQDKIAKGYKNPNHTQAAQASVDGEEGEGEDGDKEKRMHSKRKSCYFSAKKTSPDWKDPKSYSWLVNEFGKISPARVTGLTPKFQRRACDAIKRGRMMGLISHTSSDTAR